MFIGAREPSLLEQLCDDADRELNKLTVGSPEYAKALEMVVKLHKMKMEEKPSSVSKDTLLLVGANLLGIILIIRHEHVNVITSRAINWVIKPK
jgi:hypothetical protein